MYIEGLVSQYNSVVCIYWTAITNTSFPLPILKAFVKVIDEEHGHCIAICDTATEFINGLQREREREGKGGGKEKEKGGKGEGIRNKLESE